MLKICSRMRKFVKSRGMRTKSGSGNSGGNRMFFLKKSITFPMMIIFILSTFVLHDLFDSFCLKLTSFVIVIVLLVSFYKAPSKIHMPAELEYWWWSKGIISHLFILRVYSCLFQVKVGEGPRYSHHTPLDHALWYCGNILMNRVWQLFSEKS